VTLAIAGILSVVVLVAVLYPFLRPGAEEAGPPLPPDLETLLARREAIYQAMETLRLEHELGTVEEAEFVRRTREYRRQAAAALREQDSIEAEMDDLEREVLAARARLRGDAALRCQECGSPLDPVTAVCPHCAGGPEGDTP
jgi:rubrerythrin